MEEKLGVQSKAQKDLGAGSLQSLDDLEASYRQKGTRFYKGYVVNVSETCHPDNPVQLITQVQVAPNNVQDVDLMIEALPAMKERMPLDTLYTDGGYGSPAADLLLSQLQVTQYQTGICGHSPHPDKINLSDLTFQMDADARPSQVICPHGKSGLIGPGTSTNYIAYFDAAFCLQCPLHLNGSCRTRRVKHDQSLFNWAFSHKEFLWAQRRKRYLALKQQIDNPRAAVEAAMRSIKHPFPGHQLPVRGQFRITCMMVASSAMTNIRRITHYQQMKGSQKNDKSCSSTSVADSPMPTLASIFGCFRFVWQFSKTSFSF